MEDLVELMQRLLEIQSGGRERSRQLVAEDKRLLNGLQKKVSAAKLQFDSPTRKGDAGINNVEGLRRPFSIAL